MANPSKTLETMGSLPCSEQEDTSCTQQPGFENLPLNMPNNSPPAPGAQDEDKENDTMDTSSTTSSDADVIPLPFLPESPKLVNDFIALACFLIVHDVFSSDSNSTSLFG